ncbi:ClpP/crotonase [Meredithblackwellia eburnea MCA 4105]
MASHNFKTPPPKVDFNNEVIMTFPIPHTLLVTFNRPKQLNTFFTELGAKMSVYLDWADQEPEIWCIVLTGNGRAFSCGGDLKAWLAATKEGKGGISQTEEGGNVMSKTGAAGLSRRVSVTPIIAAVNGLALGGGMEIVVNCDLVIAAEDALLGLPEVKRGVFASQGALNRLIRNIGRQRASELALLGLPVTAAHAYHLGVVNRVVPKDQVLPTALNWAAEICKNSPDSVKLTKMAFNTSMQIADLEESVTAVNDSKESQGLSVGDNVKEGMTAFVERREPRWTSSKL